MSSLQSMRKNGRELPAGAGNRDRAWAREWRAAMAGWWETMIR